MVPSHDNRIQATSSGHHHITNYQLLASPSSITILIISYPHQDFVLYRSLWLILCLSSLQLLVCARTIQKVNHVSGNMEARAVLYTASMIPVPEQQSSCPASTSSQTGCSQVRSHSHMPGCQCCCPGAAAVAGAALGGPYVPSPRNIFPICLGLE